MTPFLFWIAFVVPFTPFSPNDPPLCKNCNNVIPDTLSCKLFGNTNVVTGEKMYSLCTETRKNESMCGTNGKFYVRYVPFKVVR